MCLVSLMTKKILLITIMKSNFFCLSFFVAILSSIVSCTTDDTPSQETSPTPQAVVNYEYDATELETLDLINEYRVSKGLNALEKINYVSKKSEEHNDYMIANNSVNHNDFEARSNDIIKVLNAKSVSENIAYNYNSPQGVMNAWLNSEGHRKNIEGDYTHFGIAIKENQSTGKKYFTNIFVKI